MELLFSIEEVNKRFDTSGSRPLLVHASDMEFYICKYPYHSNDPKLLNEYLAYQFAKIWKLPIPEINSQEWIKIVRSTFLKFARFGLDLAATVGAYFPEGSVRIAGNCLAFIAAFFQSRGGL